MLGTPVGATREASLNTPSLSSNELDEKLGLSPAVNELERNLSPWSRLVDRNSLSTGSSASEPVRSRPNSCRISSWEALTIGPIGPEMFSPPTVVVPGLLELETLFLNPNLKLAERLTADPLKKVGSSSIEPLGKVEAVVEFWSGSLAEVENGLESIDDPDPNLRVLPAGSTSGPTPPVAVPPALLLVPPDPPGTNPANQPARRFSPFRFPFSDSPLGLGRACGEGGGMADDPLGATESER